MQLNANLVRQHRLERHWSQSQLAEVCGLTLRTIQRLESSGKASLESVRALAAVFELHPDELLLKSDAERPLSPVEAIRRGFANYADFSGPATRAEYWWFLGFALLLTAIAAVVAETAYQIVGLIFLIPLVSAGSRRLNDAGYSGWWQLLFLVPFGFIVVLILLATERRLKSDAPGFG